MFDRRAILALSGGSLASASMSGAAAAATRFDGPAGAGDAFSAYRTLINRHDFDLLADQVMTEDAVFVFSNLRHEGIEAIRKNFNQTWSVIPDEVYRMTDVVWLFSSSDHAACTFRYAYAGTQANGQRLSGGGQGINIFRLTPRGWRLCFEQLTPDTGRRS